MTTKTNDEQYRAGFEAWISAHDRDSPSIVRAGDGEYCFGEVQVAWESWTASKREASTEPSAPGPRAWIERRYVGDEMVHETVNLQPMPAAQRKELAKHYLLEIIELAPAGAGALPDEAKDAARLEVFIEWYLREGSRSEVHLYGHTVPTTHEIVIAWLDRAAIQAQAIAGKEWRK